MFICKSIDSLLEENKHREGEGNNSRIHHPGVDRNSKDGGLREREREREREMRRDAVNNTLFPRSINESSLASYIYPPPSPIHYAVLSQTKVDLDTFSKLFGQYPYVERADEGDQ